MYNRIYSTKCPASGPGKVSEPRLISQVRTVRVDQCVPAGVDQCVPAVRPVEVPVFVCVHSSWNRVTEVGGS